jgi:Wax ester synthase-like Acyl-CoA acyltransferase domain
VIQAAQAGAHAAQAGVQAALHPREALARSRSLAELIVCDELIGAPRSSLNVTIGSTRRYTARTVPLADLKAVRRRLGGSVNDAVLAACTTGLHGLLLARGEEPPRRGLRAMVPMNLRASTEQLALGNRISFAVRGAAGGHPLAARTPPADRASHRAAQVLRRCRRRLGDGRPGGASCRS